MSLTFHVRLVFDAVTTKNSYEFIICHFDFNVNQILNLLNDEKFTIDLSNDYIVFILFLLFYTRKDNFINHDCMILKSILLAHISCDFHLIFDF